MFTNSKFTSAVPYYTLWAILSQSSVHRPDTRTYKFSTTRRDHGSSATAMSCIIVLSAVANGMTNMATASRQLFAFARDEAVPFHRWFATVPKGWDIPLNGKLQFPGSQ